MHNKRKMQRYRNTNAQCILNSMGSDSVGNGRHNYQPSVVASTGLMPYYLVLVPRHLWPIQKFQCYTVHAEFHAKFHCFSVTVSTSCIH